jgi:hypothetical protein
MFRGMEALFSSPAIVRTAAASMGLEAATFRVDPKTSKAWLGLRIHGRIKLIAIPEGTYTREQIIDLLFSPVQPTAPEPAAIATLQPGPHESPP